MGNGENGEGGEGRGRSVNKWERGDGKGGGGLSRGGAGRRLQSIIADVIRMRVSAQGAA